MKLGYSKGGITSEVKIAFVIISGSKIILLYVLEFSHKLKKNVIK